MSTTVPMYGFGGGGGTGGTLTVTAPAGVTVTVSKDGKTKTKVADSSGLAVFKGLATGEWALTITDGSQTSTKPVVITADYSTTIAFFSATINITYPAGSTCTATDGVTTLTAPDTSGTWACVVPNAGTWTVTATDGYDTDAVEVEITTDEQSINVELAFWHGELYTPGNTWDDVTGGWESLVDRSSFSFDSDCITFKNNNGHVVLYTKNKIDITDFSTLTAVCKNVSSTYTGIYIGVKPNIPSKADQNIEKGWAAYASIKSASYKELTADVSELSGSYYIQLYAHAASAKVTNVYLS